LLFSRFFPKFQSLVGKLETKLVAFLQLPLCWFQSLAGKLETKIWVHSLVAQGSFQSLVGKLETPTVPAVKRLLHKNFACDDGKPFLKHFTMKYWIPRCRCSM